jgi:transglutaminase-like putative cysteine protease
MSRLTHLDGSGYTNHPMIVLLRLMHRFRPRIGWRQVLLALCAALCPSFAATDGQLELPAGMFFWAGLLGLLIGLRIGRPATSPSTLRQAQEVPQEGLPLRTSDRRPEPNHATRMTFYALRFTFWLVVVFGLGALLIIAAAQALPPFGLVTQDITAFFTWMAAAIRRQVGWSEMPAGRTWEFLAASLPRFWGKLLIAPSDGERGARLLVTVGGIASTWIGAATLGWALAGRRNVFGWGLPLLTAIAQTAILGAGSGVMLPLGMALLLLLTIVAGFERREQMWSRAGTDYSDELGNDMLAWGSGITATLLVLAVALPTSLSNPLADQLWRDVELPSGIAVLERNIPRPPSQSKVDVGLSKLPALELGQSLEQPPPEQVVLRVRLDAPLKPAPWPRYWRARVFNLYNGREWTTNARIDQSSSFAPADAAIPGVIAQEIEDLRADREILVGLADIYSVSIGVQAERLPDGALAALTEPSQATRYRVLSRPQELAPPPQPDGAPPDMSGYLGLPRNLSPRVGDLARAIVGRNVRAYDRALALESYLRALQYSYQVQPLPGSGDAVEQFLFDIRQGYCTYYASAMAVMARTLGIPARVAIGYATGEYDQASRAYIVRESDAHAWPELYVDGRWVSFEPTPIRPLPARTIPAEPPLAAPAPAEQPERSSGPLIWAGVLAIVALLTAIGIWAGRPRRVRSLATQVQQRLERSGARAGVPWPTGATLHEYGELLEPRIGSDASALHEVVDLVGRARYGGKALRGDQEGRLRAAAARVWARLGRR